MMEFKVINDSRHNPYLNILETNYTGFLLEDQFQDICNKAIRLLIEKKVTKILVDTSKMKVLTRENKDWIQQDWYPRACRAGLTAMAFLIPDNVYGEMATKAANEPAEKQKVDVQVEYFFERQKAVDWLQSS